MTTCMLSTFLTWMDKTLLFELNLLSCSDFPFCRLFLRCSMRDSDGGLSPATLHCTSSAVASPPTGQMLMDMCCRTTRLTAAADSANRDNSLTELFLKKRGVVDSKGLTLPSYFLILAGVVSSVVLLFISQTWFSTSPALSRFLASFTRSFLIRSLA